MLGAFTVDLGAPRLRVVLALLVAEAGRTVSVPALADQLWQQHPPPDAGRTVRAYISLLRKTLPSGLIETSPHGYLLRASTDASRFEQLAAAGRRALAAGTPAPAAQTLAAALELWRGEAYGEFGDIPALRTEGTRLETLRLRALEDRIEADLATGAGGELVAELEELVTRHPGHSRLWGHLMIALYRAGRPADALAAHRRAHTVFADEFGLELSPALTEIHRRVLAQDPRLLPARSVLPRQLPAPPRRFVGRPRELAALAENQISVIGGAGGIGKTWLALHWAHQHLDRFPDGQLYANLRGFDPSGRPMDPSTALRGFLDALGADPAAMPDPDAQAALYRSIVAGRRMLIVLDNAADSAQVTPLLPGGGSCTVLVTSRHRLAGLVTAHGARSVELDMLTGAEAHELLAGHLGGDRLAAEPEAAADLLRHCAGLPLAISIVSARADAHPGFPLSVLAGELREHTLTALDGGDPSANLHTVLSWSRRTLSAEGATVFGLLGRAPGPDIGLPAAAGLTALPAAQVRSVLRELENAHLVHQHTPGRYRMHDLIRLHAAEAGLGGSDPLRRLAEFYLHTAYAGDRLLFPHREPYLADPSAQSLPLADEAAAVAWFTEEHSNLMATQQLAMNQKWHDLTWHLARSLTTYHWRRGCFQDSSVVWQAGLTAASSLADPARQTWAHRGLGHAHSRAGRHAEAHHHLLRALDLAEQSGDLPGQAGTHQGLAWAWGLQGDHDRALRHAIHALNLFQDLGMPVWEARARNCVGWHLAQGGRHAQARAHCEIALVLARRHRYRDGEANTLDSLGYIAHHTDEHLQALGHYRLALALFRELGHSYQEANTLTNLARTQHVLGRPGHAREAWLRALELYEAQYRVSDAERVRAELLR